MMLIMLPPRPGFLYLGRRRRPLLADTTTCPPPARAVQLLRSRPRASPAPPPTSSKPLAPKPGRVPTRLVIHNPVDKHATRAALRDMLAMEEAVNQHLIGALSNSIAFWSALILGLLLLYILPSAIAAIRRVDGLGWIVVINLLPTGVGWLAALILAIALPRRLTQTHISVSPQRCLQPSSVAEYSAAPPGKRVISDVPYSWLSQ